MANPALFAPPASFDVASRSALLVAHAEGVQLYQCKADNRGHLVWAFREPVATLMLGDTTIGRHFMGPSWAFDDGVRIKGKVVASTPGVTEGDIPLLKLNVVEHQGEGALSKATMVLRLNTHGGRFKGDCTVGDQFHAEPYSADYVFLD